MQHALGRQEMYKNIRHRGAEIHTNFLKVYILFVIQLRVFVSKCD